ncbi:protein kinase [Scytonema sp. UIC 10036]|uniref:serine/threonine-protein kinase n=1 Tax=Scytonema sp. UIC 10036 TaxID=2304196 RepID=UPI0012DA2ED3|nr:serine/threonine-protein kinase [Scytonema sp. UIC 10036]MUG93229.1 protein kinase [Scytonema sp. UIC 10036]
MSYCINPNCSKREQNLDVGEYCQTCGTKLLIHDRYRLIKPLRQLTPTFPTEIFEVEDTREGGVKVIKILKPDEESLQLLKWFEQEKDILTNLEYSGIPKVEKDGYFKVYLSNSQKLHCLVMEKIEGQNLEEWIQHNGVISEETAIDWLQQITVILDKVHQQDFFHRDIKPSNIMMKLAQYPYDRPKNSDTEVTTISNAKVVLIDFGTARKLTQTVIEGKTITTVISSGYTAPEQLVGRAVPQSDFYALGRTFIHLLTGIHPNKLPINNSNHQLIWREKASQISKPLADLIDRLMMEAPNQRPKDTKAILQSLEKIRSTINHPKLANYNQWLIVGLATSSIILCVPFLSQYISMRNQKILCFKDVTVPQEIFTVGGSTTWASLRNLVHPAINQTFSKFQLQYRKPGADQGPPGSTTGIQMLLNGRLNIVESSRAFLKTENKQAEEFSLAQERVAIDGVAVAVHHSLNIPGLTLGQLKDIYGGKISNWNEVGGHNLAIKRFAHHSKEWFQDDVLGKEQKFSNDTIFFEETTQGLRQLAQTPGGIYYASASLVVNQCRIRPLPIGRTPGKFIAPYKKPLIPLGSCSEKNKNQVNLEVFKNQEYPLTRDLFVIYKNYPNEDNIQEKAGKAYIQLLLTDQGQKLIEKAQFLPIKTSDRTCVSP